MTAAPMLFLVVMTILAGLTGLLLLVLGLRGRRVDDHPHCRGCGYDLSGHAESPSACPECGRNLGKSKRAVQWGFRRRRPLAATLGALLLLVSIGAVGAGAWMRVREVRIIEYYPVWLLRMDLDAPDAMTADEAMAELLRRHQIGDLDEQSARAILDDLLVMHADPNGHWSNDFSLFIETGWIDGLVADDEMIGYVKSAVDQSLTLDMRDRMRVGGPIPIRIVTGPARLSTEFQRITPKDDSEVFVLRKQLGEIRHDDRVLRDLSGSTSTSPVSPNFGWMGTSTVLDLEEGDFDVTLTARLELWRVPSRDMYKRPEYAGENVLDWTFEQTLPLTVLPADEHFIQLVANDDSEFVDALQRALYVNLMDSPVTIDGTTFHPNLGHGYVDVHRPPMNVAFRVFGRHDGIETELGTVARLEGEQAGSGWLPRPIREIYPEAKSITVILRSDREVAERMFDMDEIWNGELIVENVLLR